MRVVAWLGIMALCLAVAGCSLFGRKPWRPNPASQPAPGGPPPAQPASNPPPGRIGLLAGRVVDGFDQKPPKTYIQVIDLQAPPGTAPINVVADDNGYFTIQGLEEKHQYRLIARARDGERLMAGNVFAMTSHGNMVIKISEDFVVPGTPDVPDWPGGKFPNQPQPPAGAAGTWSSPPTPGGKPPVQLGTPAPQSPGVAPQSQGQPTKPPRPESIVDDTNKRADLEFPKVVVPPFKSGAKKVPIPSCTGSRYKLEDFALYDIEGQPWEFRQDVRGQLVLIDFWATWCGPCMRSVPELVDLHNRYASAGLEVVGICYEQPAPREQQVELIKTVRDNQHINYTVLVGDGESCPVNRYFNISGYPTLILMDREGHILWRSTGFLNPNVKQQLEDRIKRALTTH